jgi:hypothetical protein
LVVAGILNKAKQVDTDEKTRKRGLRKVAIAGLQPIDYSSDKEWTLDLGPDNPLNGQKYTAMIRGFSKQYLGDVKKLRERQRQASLDFAKDTTATEALGPLSQTEAPIVGPIRPLAIDFDETLAFGTKMVDESGKEDIASYSLRDKVEASLAKARPSRLAQRLSEVEQKNPGIVRRLTRVLTARPQTTADLVAATLNRFGLPYQATDITGVSKGLGTNIAAGKAANLAAIEKFIDDNEENIKAAEKKGVQSYRYQEPESFDDQKMYTKTGEGNIEGSLLEQALAQKLGYQINVDALEATRAIDFPAGLGNAASLFNLPSNIETEVKRTLNGSAFDKARSEFERYFTENPDRFNLGGLVQGFEDGSPGGVKDRSTKNIRRGSRGPKGFVPLEPKQYELFAEQAYAQAGEYGGSGWGNHLGVPLPKPLAEYAQKIQQWVFESGGAGMSLGKKLVKIPDNIEPDAFEALKPDLIKQYDGWYSEIEEILPFGRATATKTPAASAREARANAALAAEAGNLVYTQAEEAIGSFKKTGQLSFDQAIDSHIQKSFPGYISQLQNDLASETDPDEKASIQRKLSKAQKALPDYQALLKGAAVPNQGRITGLSETLYALLDSYGSEVSDAEVDNIIRSMGMKLSKKNIGGPLSRFADGGYVPALLTPGEAVIGPKLAKSIGYAKLNKMNYADRYASGGGVGIVPGSGNTDTFGPVPLEVGSFVIRKKATEALGFNNGGRIQKFFFGGRGRRAPAARPDTVSAETIGASTQATTALTQLAETLQALGVNGSRSAALLNRSYQATAAEAERAAQADLAAARAAGAAADVIFDLETAVQQATTATQNEIAIRQQLGDISGAAIQDALGLVQQQVDRARAAAEATLRTTPSATTGVARTEEEVQAELRAGENDRRRQAYETVAFGGGVTGTSIDLDALGADGDDLARVFQVLARDSRTLDQMNQRLTQTTRQQIEAALASGAIDEDTARVRREALEAEIYARRRAVEGVAAAEGATSPAAIDGAERQANTMRNMAIMTVGTLVADVLNTKSSATEAGIGGAIAGASQTYGATSQLIQEANNMATSLRETNPRMASFAGNITRVASRLQVFAVVAEAARQAYNAVRNFAIELEKRKVEMALEGLTEGFDKLSKDINQVDLRNQLQSKVIEAAQAAEKQRQRSQETASAGLVNGLDVLASNIQSYFDGNNYASRQSAVRGQVLETEGIIPYLETLIAGQQGIENVRGQSSQITGRETAAIFKPVAENVNQVITSRIKAGESVEQILGGPQAEDFKRTLVLADASLAAHIRSIELDTSINEASRQQRIKEVIAISGAAKTREVAEIALREKTQKNFGNMISVYTRSLQRMFNNMDQAIGATVFSLEKMKSSVDLSASSFQGQAQAGEVRLSASNIIQNPTAYSTQEVQKAAAVGGSMYGPRSAEMTQLATLGDTITSSVMSTINNTVRDQGPGVTNEALTRIIDRNLKDTLRNLGLPPELSDKLAKEVGDSIVDIRKEGEDNVDYTKLSEKIAGLGSVTEVAKNAQQNVIKALEHYQSVLNQYTTNLNRITELEVSARDRSRKSIQLVADASLNLAKALGRTVKAADVFAKRDADVARQTGGLTDPSDIFNRFLDLESVRQRQQSTVNQAAEQGLSGATDFVKFNNELKTTNIALRENRAALEDMANNTEKASAAMDAIQQAQQKAAGRVNFLEKMVTATPDELESMNGALMRLQKNINGQVNTIQNSVGAQKAYIDALNNGANAAEAMREAQTAFANERKETLGALQDLLPFLGDNQQGNEIRANVLETMLQESGMGMSPIMQQVLNSLRNPEQDPSTAAAIQYYNQAINEQANATRLLGKLDADLADRIARSNSQLIVEGLTKAVLTFTNSELKDIAGNVNSIVSIMKNPGAPGAVPAAPGIATGGLIYAAAGQMVNFQPRGTDTVPAMLTPGEFVVNRKATQANLPLLKSINNGYANGGKVSYYAAGGFVSNWGDPTKLTESTQILSKPILDPAPDNNGKEWELAKSSLFSIPNAYTVNYDPFSQPIPSKANFDLDSPSLTANSVVPGYTPDIVKRGKYYDYSENVAARSAAETLRPAKNVGELYFRNPFNEGNLIKDLPKNREQQTKDAIKTKFAGIESVNPIPANPDPASFGSAPNAADVFNQSPGRIQTSFVGSSQGLFYAFGTNAPSVNPKPITDFTGSPALGIYELNTYADVIPEFAGGGRPNAVSLVDTVGKKNLSFGVDSPYQSTWYSGKDWQIKAPKSITKYPSDFATSLNTIPGDQVARKNADNLRAAQWIKNTQDFLNDAIPYSETDSVLQNQLFNLFSGTKGSEIIVRPNTQVFDKLGSPDSILIAQNTMRDKFIVALESAMGSRETAKRKNIKFGIPGAGFPVDADFTLDDGFKITDTRGGGRTINLPFMINGKPEDLGLDFQKQAGEEAFKETMAKGGISTKFLDESIKLNLPAAMLPPGITNGIDIPISYTQYTGRLYDDAQKDFVGDPFTYLLPNPTEQTLFKELQTDRRRLFTNKKYTDLDILAASNLKDPNVGLLVADVLKSQLNKDPNLADKVQQLKKSVKLTFDGGLVGLTKSIASVGEAGVAGKDIFSAFSNTPFEVAIGEFFVDKLQSLQTKLGEGANKADTEFVKMGVSLDDNEARQATINLIRGSMQLFNGIAGLPSGWIAANGGSQALRIAALGDYQEAASIVGGILNGGGNIVSQLMSKAQNQQSVNVLSNAHLLLSGGANVLGDISQGNTSLLKQFLDAGTDPKDIFRSYGATAKFGKVSAMRLSGDWKNLLTNQLNGTKIRTVGRNGTITESSLATALPENSNVSDLVKIIFNPYNEFQQTDTRRDLIQKFGNDLSNLRAPNSTIATAGNALTQFTAKYFDPMTLSWIREGLTRLTNWYGGVGDWLGQDYFFDKKAQPDNAARMTEFVDSFNRSGMDIYQKAQEAQVLFGLANQFGPLPSLQWFTARAAAAAGAQKPDDPMALATGGVVYASTGKLINYQPRGTDTVPAMLTPGEFVVNRAATQKHLPLLQSINNGSGPGAYSKGGVVYLKEGSFVRTVQNRFSPVNRNIFAGLDPDKDDRINLDESSISKDHLFRYMDFMNRGGDGILEGFEFDFYNQALEEHMNNYLSAQAKEQYDKIKKVKSKDVKFIQSFEAANAIPYNKRKISGRNPLEENYFGGDINFPFTPIAYKLDNQERLAKLGVEPVDFETFAYGLASKAIPGLLSVAGGGLGFLAGGLTTPVTGPFGPIGGAIGGGVAGDFAGQALNGYLYNLLPNSVKERIEQKIKTYPEAYGTGQWTGFAAEIAGGAVADEAIAKSIKTLISKKVTAKAVSTAISDASIPGVTRSVSAADPSKAVSDILGDAGNKAASQSKKVVGQPKAAKSITQLTPVQIRQDLIKRSQEKIIGLKNQLKNIQKNNMYQDVGVAAVADEVVAERRMWEELLTKQSKLEVEEAVSFMRKEIPTRRTIVERANKVRQQRVRSTSIDDLSTLDLSFELDNLMKLQSPIPKLSARLDNIASKMQTSGLGGQQSYAKYHNQILAIKNNAEYFKRVNNMPENLLDDQIKLLQDPNAAIANNIPLQDVSARLDAFRARAKARAQAAQSQPQAAAQAQPQAAGPAPKAPDPDDVKPKPKTDDAKPKDPNELKGLTAAKKAEAIRTIAKNARDAVDSKIAAIKNKWTNNFLTPPNPGSLMDAESRTLVNGIFQDDDYIKAFQAAKNAGAADRLAYAQGIEAYNKAGKLNPLQQQLDNLGYTIDSRTGKVSFTDDYFDRFVTNNSAYKTASETEINQAIDEAIKGSVDTYNSGRRFGKIDPKDPKIRTEFDAPGSIRARTWSDFLKEQKIRVKNTTFNKYTGLGLLGAAMVAWYTWKQNKDAGSDRTGEGERLPGGKVGGGAGGVGGGGAGGGGAVVGRPPDFDPAADVAKAQMDSKTIPVPDYYDELTYKKYASKIIARGQFPKEPERSRFTTAAFYSIDQEGNKFRTTAYEQRGGNRFGYSARADFVPGRGPMDARQVDQDQVQAALDAGRGRRPKEFGGRGEKPIDQNLQEGFTPVGRFSDQANPAGVRNFVELPSNMRMGQGRQKETAKEKDERITGQYAVKAQAERGGKKIQYSKGPDLQYRNALAWYINRRGEYGYYSTKNQKIKENWMKKFAWADAMSNGGMVYASSGTLVPYQPKGTDTVPAMLTPGEFVVNRAATQKNLPLLKSINSGAMSKGGVVYLARGGEGGVAYSNKPSSNLLPQLEQEKQSAIFIQTLKNMESRIGEGVKKTGDKYDQKSQTRFASIDTSQKALINTSKITNQKLSDIKQILELQEERHKEIIFSIGESYQRLQSSMVTRADLTNTENNLDQAITASTNSILAPNSTINVNIATSKADIRKDIQDRYDDLVRLIVNEHTLTRRVILSALDFLDAKDPTKGGRLAKIADINPFLFDVDPNRPLDPNRPNRPRKEVGEFLSSGGMVYANQGMLIPYQPKGTDTVPAMLTPGEFVVNRAATQSNLPLLHAINNGAAGYAQGGVVYAKDGKEIPKNNSNQSSPTSGGTVSINDANPALNSMFNSLRSYASDSSKNGMLAKAFTILKEVNLVISDQATRDMIGGKNAVAAYQYTSDADAGTAYFASDKPKTDMFMHEMAHGLAKISGKFAVDYTGFPSVIKFLQQMKNIPAIINDPMVYKPEFLKSNPKELFPTLVQLTGSFPNLVREPLSAVMQAMGFNSGGVVYANNGMLVNYQPKGTDTVPAMLTPGEFVVNAKAASKNLSLLQGINSGSMSNGGIVYLRRGGSSDPNMIQNTGGYAPVPSPTIQNIIDPQLFTNINQQLATFATSLGIANRGLSSQFSGTIPTSQFSGGIDLQSILGNFTSNLQNITTNLGQLVSTIQGVNNTNGGEANNQTPSGPDLTGLASFTQKFDSLIQQLQNIIIPPEVNINLVQNQPWNINVNGAEVLNELLSGPLSNLINNAIADWDNSKKDQSERQA